MKQIIFSRLPNYARFPLDSLVERQRQVILRITAVAGIALSVVLYTLAELTGQNYFPYSTIPYASFLLLFALPWIARHERLRIANHVLVFSLFLALSISAYFTGGILSPSFAGLLILILFAGLVIGIKIAVVLTAFYMTSGLIYVFTEVISSQASSMMFGSSSSTMCTQATYLIGGLLILYVMVIRAGSERTEPIKASEMENEIYQNLLNCNRHTFFAFDRVYRITEWSSGMEILTGVHAAKALGKSVSEMVPSFTDEGDDTMRSEVHNKRIPHVQDIHCKYPETQQGRQFEAHSYPLQDASGEIVGGLVVLHEPEDHENAGCSEIEERFRHMAQTTSDAIILVNDDGEIIYWNLAAVDIFGYSEEDMMGKPFTMLVPATHAGRLRKELHRIRDEDVTESQAQKREGLAIRKGQEEFPVKLSFSSWKIGGEKRFCAVIRDATEEKDVQKQLLFQERLGTIGSLAAGVAHDFNNALMPIGLHTEMLLTERSLSEACKRVLEIILRQTRHAGELSKQLLAFSRESRAKMQTTDLKRTLQELEQLLLRTLPENILLSFEYKPGSFMLQGDSNRLQQAFLNLTINARDAMPAGGDLRFRLSRRSLTPEAPPPFPGMSAGDWIRLDITDTGEGIPAELLPRIFEPFFTTKDTGEGHGLGLAQTYNVVKQHNGYIDVVSRLGKCTTFTIYFPSLRGGDENEQEDSNMEMILNGEKETILLVEDDSTSLQAVREALEYLNYRVVAVASGREALDAYENDRIHLVVSDMVMPDMSGVELYGALADHDPNLKMMIMTGYPLEEIGKDIIKRGVIGLIKKPTNMTTLSHTIRKALSTEISPDNLN